MNNVETWVMPVAATNQYTQYYANVQSGTYIPYNSTSTRPDFFEKLTNMIKARESVDFLKEINVIDEEDYKRILNNIRLEELKEDFDRWQTLNYTIEWDEVLIK